MPSARVTRQQILAAALLACALITLASLLDQLAYSQLDYARVYQTNWGRLLRTIGYLPFWLLAGAAYYRIAASPPGRRNATLLMAVPTLAGASSELLKLLIRRGRPTAAEGAYVFQSFAVHPFDTAHFGMPSGDATVAFAACALLARIWPEARSVWYGLAVGCALARVASHAHFLSDVTAAALLGWAASDLAWRRYALASAPPT